MHKTFNLIFLLACTLFLTLNCGNKANHKTNETQAQFVERIKNSVESKFNCKAKITGSIKLSTSNVLNTLDIKIDSLQNDSLLLNEIASKVTLLVFKEISASNFKDTFLNLEVSSWEDPGTSSNIYKTSITQYNNLVKQLEVSDKFLSNWKDKKFKLNYPLIDESLEIAKNDSIIQKNITQVEINNGEIKNWIFKGYMVQSGEFKQKEVRFSKPTYLINFKDTAEYFQFMFILPDTISNPKIIGTMGVM